MSRHEERDWRDAEILGRLRGGETQEAVASDYGITRQMVSLVALKAGFDARATRRALREREREARRAARAERLAARGDKMLEELRALAHRLGRTPSKTDIEAAGLAVVRSATTYQSRFGSLAAAQIAAGLVPNGTGKRGPDVWNRVMP